MGLDKREIKTMKDYTRINFLVGHALIEDLGRSLNVIRATVHSSTNEPPFKRHCGRKPRTELNDQSNLLSNSETLSVQRTQKHYRCICSQTAKETTTSW